MTPLNLTCQIVSAYVAHNHVQQSELPGLLDAVYLALVGQVPVVLKPAVPIAESVQSDHIVCLEDGKKQVSMRVHLKAAHGLTPEQYRKKWGLPISYPMLAPTSSDRRSAIAKSMGLGHHPDKNTSVRRKKA